MSIAAIRAALETRLLAMTPTIGTAPENNQFTPTPGAPYQRMDLLPGSPENPAYGTYYREVGVFQVTLCYPQNGGPGAAQARAAMIRDWFKRGSTLVASGIEVTVRRTPAIGPGFQDGDRFCIPVSIDYFASVFA